MRHGTRQRMQKSSAKDTEEGKVNPEYMGFQVGWRGIRRSSWKLHLQGYRRIKGEKAFYRNKRKTPLKNSSSIIPRWKRSHINKLLLLSGTLSVISFPGQVKGNLQASKENRWQHRSDRDGWVKSKKYSYLSFCLRSRHKSLGAPRGSPLNWSWWGVCISHAAHSQGSRAAKDTGSR